MMPDQDQPTQNPVTTNSSPKRPKWLVLAILVVVLLVLGVAAALLTSKDKKKETPVTPATSDNASVSGYSSLSLTPDTETVTKGTPFTLSVWVDSGDQPINAVQANLTYPKDQFDFVSIDSVGSSFEIQAQSTGGEGKIVIARAQIGGVVGKHLVSKITLTPKVDSAEGAVTFAEGSKVAEAGKDVLGNKTGGKYTIKAAQ